MRPEAQLEVYQCAQFSAYPKIPPDQSISGVLKYLKGMALQVLIMKPDP